MKKILFALLQLILLTSCSVNDTNYTT
ncbi:MAG: lipoprotein, partial [Paludibacteraceae bacterium]|nr:lipoprotein [Paludibacteraceae bacterium]